MSVLKLIILCLFLVLSPFVFAESSEIQSVPTGQWQSVKIQKNGKNIPSLDVNLFSYKNNILLFEFTEKSTSCFRINNQSDYFDVAIINLCPTEELVIDKIYFRNNQLELVSDEMHYFFTKKKVRPIVYKELSAVWERKSKADKNDVHELTVYPDRRVIFSAKTEDESQLARVFITEESMLYIVVDDMFLPVFYSGEQLDVIADEKYSFTRTDKKLPSQFMTDENGLPVEIDQFSITAKVNGDLVETTIDIGFRTLDTRDTEVAFSLPLPAGASVSGYSLDVNGHMVPAVVVPKEEARDILETLESRGVDPAVAELTHNNKFQTEIYPVSKNNPRRIQIQYQESLKDVDGRYRYSIPLDVLGEFKHFSLNIELEGIETLNSSHQSAVSNKQLRIYKTSKEKQILRFSAENFSANSELIFNFKPEKKSMLQVQSGSDENIYFRMPLNVSALPVEPENILVLWDTSLSMRIYHEQYLDWLRAIRREYPKVNIKVQPFSINTQQSVDLQLSIQAIETFAASIVYDGASNLNSVKDFIGAGQEGIVLFFSDAVHSVGLLDLKSAEIPLHSVYPDSRTSNMPLLESLSAKGSLAGVGDLTRESIRSFFSVLPKLEVKSGGDNIFVKRRFDANAPIEILGMLNKTELPYRLAVSIDGTEKEFWVDDEHLSVGSSIQYLWATNKIQPLLVNPTQNKQSIVDTGMKYSIVTPYTSFLVLEDIDDYVEFGVKPPALFDPDNEYDELRVDYLARQSKDKERGKEKLLAEWKQRVEWYENPVAFNKRFLKESQATYSASLEEVMVTGARASAPEDEQVEEVIAENVGSLEAGIKIAAWNPDTPYMTAIRAVPIDKAYSIYLQQRNEYALSQSFYMDVAKYFFDKNRPDAAYKVLSNISEIKPEKMLAQRLVAYTLMEYQQWEHALLYLKFVNEIVPHEATSKRDLAVLLEHMASPQAPDLILQSAAYYWQSILLDDSFKHDLAITTLGELNNVIQDWKLDPDKIPGFDRRFIYAMEFDLRLVISWTNNQADMDLHVSEPDNTKIYYGEPYSKSGAWLPFDNTSGFGPEEYLLKSATKGVYKVAADFYANSSVEEFGPVTVRVDIYRNYGRKNQVHKTTTVRLGDAKDNLDLAEVSVR